MRHSKRKRLVSSDLSRALRLFDAQPIYGHDTTAAHASNAGYIPVPEAEVYVEDDEDCVDLAEVALGHSDIAINDGGGLSLQGKEGCSVLSLLSQLWGDLVTNYKCPIHANLRPPFLRSQARGCVNLTTWLTGCRRRIHTT